MPDIGQQTNPAGKSGKILKMPGHDPAREVGRQAIGTPGMALAPCLDRHGKLRQQVGREDEVDAGIVAERRQRIHASARLPGEPCCDTGQVGRDQLHLRMTCAPVRRHEMNRVHEDDPLEALHEMGQRHVAQQPRAEDECRMAARQIGRSGAYRSVAARLVRRPRGAAARRPRPERDGVSLQSQARELRRGPGARVKHDLEQHRNQLSLWPLSGHFSTVRRADHDEGRAFVADRDSASDHPDPFLPRLPALSRDDKDP
jgi:hypothetical protein